MKCCGSGEPAPIDLKTLQFEPIYLNIEKSKLRFFANDKGGTFKLVNTDESKNQQEKQQLSEKERILHDEILRKQERINQLKEKILEINSKIESMNKILNIDISEKDYITTLGERVKAQSQIKG